jgi:hypothetical protein
MFGKGSVQTNLPAFPIGAKKHRLETVPKKNTRPEPLAQTAVGRGD